MDTAAYKISCNKIQLSLTCAKLEIIHTSDLLIAHSTNAKSAILLWS